MDANANAIRNCRSPNAGMTDARSPVAAMAVPAHVELRRGSDYLVAIPVQVSHDESVGSICRRAAMQYPDLPLYQPDGLGVVMVFHTPSGMSVLGASRPNPCLANLLTLDGNPFPLQFNSCIGGYLPSADVSVKSAIRAAVNYRLSPQTPDKVADVAVQRLVDSIDGDDGWAESLSVHTDSWDEKGTIKTMCFVTLARHFVCSDADLERLATGLARQAAQPNAAQFGVAKLGPMLETSKAHLQLKEVQKAQLAWETYGNQVAVAFNDLAMVVLDKAGAFPPEAGGRAARLVLD